MDEIFYIDTRGGSKEPISFSEAVVKGISDSGGLYVPSRIPRLDLEFILSLAKHPYWKRAVEIYKVFATDFSEKELETIMKKSYTNNFDCSEICPINFGENNIHTLELWHGPTSAFKDMALQNLPNIFSASAKKLRNKGKINHDFLILVATSGDTGKAALEGFSNVPGVSVMVLYPKDGVSDIQRKQMLTQKGSNVNVVGIEGVFDDCQNIVKEIFNSSKFNDELLKSKDFKPIALSSANSINWGRLMPQIVYYVSAYAKLVEYKKVQAGNKIDICVPTGNFGNILAAWYAKQMGTPINKLICASNENRILTDFIESGIYDISNRKFILTPSPSMDILISSNLERQLFELNERNFHQIYKWMDELKTKKKFQIDKTCKDAISASYLCNSIDSQTCLNTIKNVFMKTGYLIDTHTAVAYKTAEGFKSNRPMLVVSTAHWAKFGKNVYRALNNINVNEALPSSVAKITDCQLNQLIQEQAMQHGKTSNSYSLNIPENLNDLDKKPFRFNQNLEAKTTVVKQAIKEFLKQQN